MVDTADLTQFAYSGDRSRMERDVYNLVRQGRVEQHRTSVLKQESRQVLALTKRGKRLIRHQNFVPEDQAIYSGFVKPNEADHDADLYRLYQKAAGEIERKGGKVLGVQLDYELKEKLYQRLGRAQARGQRETKRLKETFARDLHLPVVRGKVSFPDLRIEYTTQESEIVRLDLELATRHYHAGHLAEKARAVIQRYLAEEIPERPSTPSRYRCWLKNHVEPKWRDYPIEKIKPLLVEDWLKKLNLAPKSKSHFKNLMRVLFNAAMRWELIPYQHNPMSLVRVKDGSKRQRQPKALSVEEFRKLLEHIPEPFRTMCIVAMCLGLRASEILGLRWRDIDWEDLRLAIQQAYVYGREGDVKTQASQRWMPLDRLLADKLRQHKENSAPFANSEAWIFANPETGRPYWPGRIQENWLVPAAQRAGLGRIGWHTFRHNHSTLLHALGVDLKVQQELLRHADIRATMNIYTQAVPTALREANGKVVRLVLPVQVA